MQIQLPDFVKEHAWHIVTALIMSVSSGVGIVYATGLKEGMILTKQEVVASREAQAKTGQEITEVKDDLNTVKQDVAEMKGKVLTVIELLKRKP